MNIHNFHNSIDIVGEKYNNMFNKHIWKCSLISGALFDSKEVKVEAVLESKHCTYVVNLI